MIEHCPRKRRDNKKANISASSQNFEAELSTTVYVEILVAKYQIKRF